MDSCTWTDRRQTFTVNGMAEPAGAGDLDGRADPDRPDIRAILALSDAGTPEFIRREVAAKRFHKTVRGLNEEVPSGDPKRRAAAAKALRRLGFP